MRCLISYDVSEDRRRQRVVKRLLKGAHRIQYSVFEGDLPSGVWDSLWRDLQGLIDPQTDSLLLVPLCEPCERGRRFYGVGRRVEVPDVQIV